MLFKKFCHENCQYEIIQIVKIINTAKKSNADIIKVNSSFIIFYNYKFI